MRKYWTIFKIEWIRLLELRLDFWMGRCISILTFLTNYYLWTTVFADRTFAGYSLSTIVTYVLCSSFVFNAVFLRTQERIGWEIVEGTLNTYLVRPMHYFFYNMALSAARRLLYIISIVAILALFIPFLHAFFIQTHIQWILLFIGAWGIATALYTLLDFLMGISSFWLYRSFGPKWIMEIALILASGVIFPLDLFPEWLYRFLLWTPIPYLGFFPVSLYLGRLSPELLTRGFLVAGVWLLLLALLVRFLFARGLKRYEGAGI